MKSPYIAKFIPKYFCLILFSNFELLASTNTIDFYILIWYPVTLLNPLLVLIILVYSLGFFHKFDPFILNKDIITSSFPICMPFFLPLPY